MKKSAFQAFISQIESQSNTIRYDFQIADAFSKLLKEHEAELDEEQKKKLELEFILFRFTTKTRFSNDGLKTERFKPIVTYTNGSFFPDPNGQIINEMDYFEHRAKQTTSAILRTRYYDFLWEKSKSKQKHRFAQEAMKAYLEAFDVYEDEDAIFERLDCLQRATELVLILENKQVRKPLTDLVIKKLNQEIDKYAAEKKYRWLIETFELVIALSAHYSEEQIQRYVDLCNEAGYSYLQQQNFHILRSFLDLKLQFFRVLKKSDADIKAVSEEIADSYIGEADSRGDNLVKTIILQQAVDLHTQLGNKEVVNQLIATIKKHTKLAVENKEFKQISTSVDIKDEDIKRWKKNLGKGYDVPKNMVRFIPLWQNSVNLAKKHKKQFIFQNLFPTVHYGNDYPVYRPQTEEEIEEDQAMNNYIISAELNLKMLTSFFEEMKKKKQVQALHFTKFFEKIKLIDEDTYESIEDGLQKYFQDDYYGAMTILPLQMEDLLRRVLALLGGNTTTRSSARHAFQEKTLEPLLEELKPHIGQEVYRYIDWVLLDFRGMNLRNNVAHGFMKKKNAHPIYIIAVLHIICILLIGLNISTTAKRSEKAV